MILYYIICNTAKTCILNNSYPGKLIISTFEKQDPGAFLWHEKSCFLVWEREYSSKKLTRNTWTAEPLEAEAKNSKTINLL